MSSSDLILTRFPRAPVTEDGGSIGSAGAVRQASVRDDAVRHRRRQARGRVAGPRAVLGRRDGGALPDRGASPARAEDRGAGSPWRAARRTAAPSRSTHPGRSPTAARRWSTSPPMGARSGATRSARPRRSSRPRPTRRRGSSGRPTRRPSPPGAVRSTQRRRVRRAATVLGLVDAAPDHRSPGHPAPVHSKPRGHRARQVAPLLGVLGAPGGFTFSTASGNRRGTRVRPGPRAPRPRRRRALRASGCRSSRRARARPAA